MRLEPLSKRSVEKSSLECFQDGEGISPWNDEQKDLASDGKDVGVKQIPIRAKLDFRTVSFKVFFCCACKTLRPSHGIKIPTRKFSPPFPEKKKYCRRPKGTVVVVSVVVKTAD